VVHIGVVPLLVHAEDDGDVLSLGRGTDEDLPCSGIEVCACLVRALEEAGRLDDHVDTKLAPRQARRILLGQHLNHAAVDYQPIIIGVDAPRVWTVR
jgi:hypothetical protein